MTQPRMITHQKIRPHTIFSARTKHEALTKLATVGGFCHCFGGGIQARSSKDGNTIFVYTAEKIRAKFSQKKTFSKKTGQTVTKSVKLREGQWNIRVFSFDKKSVVSAIQMDRTFRAVLK